jgi:hypothetical protein
MIKAEQRKGGSLVFAQERGGVLKGKGGIPDGRLGVLAGRGENKVL